MVECGHIKVADTHLAHQESCTMPCKNLSILELEIEIFSKMLPHPICQTFITPFDPGKSILEVQKTIVKGFGDYHPVITLILHLHSKTSKALTSESRVCAGFFVVVVARCELILAWRVLWGQTLVQNVSIIPNQ